MFVIGSSASFASRLMNKFLYLGASAAAGAALVLLLTPQQQPESLPAPAAPSAARTLPSLPAARPPSRSIPSLPAPALQAQRAPAPQRAQQSLPQQLRRLLEQGEDYAALELHRTQCRNAARLASHCRHLLREQMGQLIEKDPKRLERMLPAYLDIEVEDPPAVFYQAILYSMRFRYRDALNRLTDLRNAPQSEVPAETITETFDEIVRRQLESLRARDDPQALLEFLQFMIRIESDNPVHFYRLANVQRHLLQYGDALDSLNRIIYDSQWGSRARAMAAEIQGQLEEAERQLAEAERQLEEAKQVRVPLVRQGEHFLVQADVGGYGTLQLLIDTGASLTVLKRRAFRQLGLPEREIQFIIMHTPNGSVKAPVMDAGYLQIASLPVHDFRVALLELDNLPDADGLLGMNYLGQFDFYIDQNEEALYLSLRK